MKSSTGRWLPALIAPLLVAGMIAAPAAIAASVPPSLPERTAAQVLALSATGGRVSGYTATVQQRVDLGLPDISALTGTTASSYAGGESTAESKPNPAAEALTLLTSDQDARVQVGQVGLKIQLTTGRSEKSLTVNSKEAWTWDWDAKEAMRYTFPTATGTNSDERAKFSELRAAAADRLSWINPQAVAQSLLDGLETSTTVRLGQNVRVANHDAYELTLTPKQSASLVRDVRVAIDAETGMVLRVQIFAKADNKLAYSLGYASLTYGEPNASAFEFKAPSDAKVIEKQLALPKISADERAKLRADFKELRTKITEADSPAQRRQLAAELSARVSALLGETSAVAVKPNAANPMSDLNMLSISGFGWASVAHLPAGTVDLSGSKQLRTLLEPLGNGAYGLQSTLLSVRISADGSVDVGSVPLESL